MIERLKKVNEIEIIERCKIILKLTWTQRLQILQCFALNGRKQRQLWHNRDKIALHDRFFHLSKYGICLIAW